ncbi:4-oxalomesaconate tautomerase [Haliscomenobacter sp.]|uniref:4-oxalomesaconate tautomerase n=1 Tax=Haliscomenobacter sp. TaxID=2717303 RepID=UPI003BAAC8BE
MQKAIPYMQLRGGSSKGLFFLSKDLPEDVEAIKRSVLLAMEGTTEGDPRQIDGLGGAHSLTSKAAVVGPSKHPDADVDYLFLQVVVGKGQVSTGQTCGNILAGVAPFSIETGLVKASDPVTRVRVNMLNTGGICEVLVETPGRQVNYEGTARIDGVPGTAAPIICNYLDVAGSTCGALLPTGKVLDEVDGYELTCIDNGMPVVLLRAADFGLSGYESVEDLSSNLELKAQIEQIRLKVGPLMNLGNVAQKTVPKMCLIAPPKDGGVLHTRMFIPHVLHDAIGVLAAISVATAVVVPGSIAEGISQLPSQNVKLFSIEHPSGECTVQLNYELLDGKIGVKKAGVLRTARLLSRGELFVEV